MSNFPRLPYLMLPIVIALSACNTPQQRAYNEPAPIPPPQQQPQSSASSSNNPGEAQSSENKDSGAQQAREEGSAQPPDTAPTQQASNEESCEPTATAIPDVEIIDVPLDENGNPIEPTVATTNSEPSGDECLPKASQTAAKQSEKTKSAKQQESQSSQSQQSAQSAGAPSTGGAQTNAERAAAANSNLDQRLAAFDDLMRKAREAAAAERQAAGAGNPAGALGGLGANQRMPEQERGAGGQADSASGLGHTPDQSGETRPGDFQHQATGPIPADLPDSRDDDIVARQLREAATKESDPVLREKLWQEYRRYKSGL
ncbi:MAG: hypothetical protein AAF387_08065 [Pseudomonadota bacterium]